VAAQKESGREEAREARRAEGTSMMARLTVAVLALLAPAPLHADSVRITIPAEIVDFAPYWIADQRGYFKEEGIDIEFVIMGGQNATPALISGSTKFSGSTSSAMSAALRGAALKTVLIGQSRTHHQLWSFDPAVKTLADLKGKLVTVTSRGGADDVATRMYLKARGLPSNYVGITPLASGPARNAAVLNGAVKYVTLGRPDRHELTSILDKGTLLIDLPKEVELPTGGLATTAGEIANNRAGVKKMLRAVWKGTIFWMTQPAEATIAEMQKRYPRMARDLIVRDLNGAREDLDDDGVVSMESAARDVAVRAELMELKEPLRPAAEIFDFSIISEVRAELAAQNWRPAP
jgi:NitT/TauT family transport system substrate-binding protein